jgi:hypothetical protein
MLPNIVNEGFVRVAVLMGWMRPFEQPVAIVRLTTNGQTLSEVSWQELSALPNAVQ